MRINKITTGFVVQTWDTELKKWISQEFLAGDEINYEKADGDAADPIEPREVWPGWPDTEPCLPFEMKPPEAIQPGAPRFYILETVDDIEPQLHGRSASRSPSATGTSELSSQPFSDRSPMPAA
jgi:hypothetical protein